MLLKKWLKKSMIIALVIVMPTTMLVSCSSYDTDFTYDTNYITSAFYNSYDMLTSFGIAPKTQAYANKGLEKKYWDYMAPYIDESKTKFAVFGQSSSVPNLAQLRSFKTYTLILNEWARVDENKYIGPNNSGAKHVAYTSMGDSKESKYYKETSTNIDANIDWHNYNEGLFSYRNATEMLAKDLDKYFYNNPAKVDGKVFNTYSERADFIFENDKKRINSIRSQVQSSSLKGKTIGIFSGQDGGGGTYVPAKSLTAIYEPFLYPQLYGPENIGFGLKFPKPTENTGKELKWADPGNLASVTAKDASILKQSFQNKFDYIIYVASPGLNQEEIKKQFNDFSINSFFKSYSITENNQTRSNNSYDSVIDKKFAVVKYEDWYPTAWGPIGVSKLVSEMVKVLNKFLSANSKETESNKITDTIGELKLYDKKDLINPNKK